MGFIGKILSGPLSGIIDSVGGLLDKVSTTDAERLAAKQELLKIERDFQVAVLALDTEFAKAQADVIKTEMQSASWMARSWRPILMLTFTFIIAWQFILAPVFGLVDVAIPTDMWDLLKIGMGGYIFGRSAEKVLPDMVTALKK
ncbi:MAG TPA: 3TM-type holin [Anaerolineae bacterium]|nr:3TM-type holin [Anaerolineae bacterium]